MTADIKKALRKKKEEEPPITDADYLSTGSTLLNLACTGRTLGGFLKGKYYFFVGDSSSGKTFFCLTCFAEAANNINFKDYRLIFDNAEDGALMDFPKFFGQKMADKIEAPGKEKDGTPIYSENIEDFYYHVDDAIKADKPFIYVLDSMDSLSSEQEIGKFADNKKASREGKDTTGTYTDGKAKINSSNLRQLISRIRETGSILIIINQTRDNIGFGAQFNPKTRSGGHALKFYACLEMWSKVMGNIDKTVRGKKRQIGIKAGVRVKKNRITGKDRSIEVPIYHSYGIDDIESCVNFLIYENHWEKAEKEEAKGARKRGKAAPKKDKDSEGGKGKYCAPEFSFTGTPAKLIEKIQEEGLEDTLRGIVQEVWDDIEKACEVPRKKRYE